MISLDGFASDSGRRPPSVIKIDVEGEEFPARGGADQLIARHHPVIICEVHGTETGVRQRLQNAGYGLRTLEDGDQMAWNAHILAVPG